MTFSSSWSLVKASMPGLGTGTGASGAILASTLVRALKAALEGACMAELEIMAASILV